ncbi:MAG: glycosyl hydrolase 115 family protein [Candidatus Symbiothrix sp.]|jgi:hypothetical protein|nr:glycosyl hydrolase 115 family protein [Candidatus Symbiothrix sp.]
MKKILFLYFVLIFIQSTFAANSKSITMFTIEDSTMADKALFETGRATFIYVDRNEKEFVHTAVSLLQKDVQTVFGAYLQRTEDPQQAQIIVSSLQQQQGKWEAFSLITQEKKGKNQLIISGSDARGKAYGILELSRMIGVSPWHYFADAKPEQRTVFMFPETTVQQSPSVRYRGIFLNDEDWGLMPWATQTLAPNSPLLMEKVQGRGGAIGPEVYEKIFELMLRLRANIIWPAMHECTVPFYFVKGNREIADKYGIVVGTSHCEPLARNSASEWDVSGTGDYNFITNRQHILNYWTERLKELQHSENIFTIGMRGKHDGMMQGVKTLEEHKNALSQIIPAQQELLRQYIRPNLEEIPQAFIPYKEVLEVYDDGLEVPDYVSLVWCDDNYGYIRRLSNENERLRAGSSGVYYHVSYWGRPHDCLWLASTSPALIYTEMKRAYEHGADRLWMLNVGDIKPAEYLTEFFMDLAWNIHLIEDGELRIENVFSHLSRWTEREFGKQNSETITSVMKEYYRLANIRKPEFMGWSRVEESGYPRGGLTPVKDSEYNPEFNNELQRRINDYQSLEEQVAEIKQNIPGNKQSAFFQLVEYSVRGASLMSQKWLYAQLAHHYTPNDIASAKESADKSLRAYNEIERITETYNRMENGKWNRIMDFRPRALPVFDKPEFTGLDSLANAAYKPVKPKEKEANRQQFVLAQNANQAINLHQAGKAVEGLGHSFSAVEMQQGQTLTFVFDIPSPGEYWIKIATLPNHDVDGKGMKIVLSVADKDIREFDYHAEGRSEIWKENVLRGQAVSSFAYYFPKAGKVNISVRALTPYIILDQIMIGKGQAAFYEFPVKDFAYVS